MSEFIILYDEPWLYNYIEQLKDQKRWSEILEYKIQNARNQEHINKIENYQEILRSIQELKKSLEITENALELYFQNAHDAAMRLQRECDKIELPEFF